MKRETLLGQQMTHLEGHSVVRSFLCSNFDMNCRIAGEELGFYKFAWLPKKCRNGFRVWLKWVECRRDGTFTLGDRAHD